VTHENTKETGEHPMAASSSGATVRELDRRSSAGIEVQLLWDPRTDQVPVAVADSRSGESFELRVAGADALATFRHPYAYANHDNTIHALAA
jgi:hypothetical protein